MAAIKLTKQQQQMIVAAVLGIGGFGYAYIAFFWLPISAKIGETKQKIEQVQAKIEKATQQAARLPRLEKELIQLNEQAIEAEKRLPKKRSVPDILVTVGGLANKHGVALNSFTPAGMAQKAFFTELSYSMSVRGSYHRVGLFLAAVALEERIFNVSNIVYGGGESGELSVTFTLISYQYKG